MPQTLTLPALCLSSLDCPLVEEEVRALSREGDSLTFHNAQKFSTFDKDQDVYDKNCAKMRLGAFWYAACINTNPNGVYLWKDDDTHNAIGVIWYTWKNSYSVNMKSISMKIKPVF